ncbi:MAG: hypothetical protein ABFC97_04850 [Anaerolineaceae bacterium]|nr:hypothetical protein [Anaerolineaceae bacterium]
MAKKGGRNTPHEIDPGQVARTFVLGKKSHPVRMAKKGGRDTPDEIDPGQVARTFVVEIKKPPC